MRRISPAVPMLILGLASFFVAPFTSAQATPPRNTSTVVWNNVGPYGGDARSFGFSPSNPAHILMGTTNSWIYQTNDGHQWTRLSRITDTDTLVLDHIVFDESNPERVLVGAWRLDRPDGGIFSSDDGGQKWQPVADMAGQSVRALAQAPSNPKIFVAGTLKGVYRSEDGGQHWTLISPVGSMELHEIESIAIDPANPEIIYAGTWHLPWKTEDGGKNWKNIKQGLIVDSDVFSIIIDPHAANVVYTSACSGIYKSTDAGMAFHKIQGIPSTARRTRVLKQDPSNASIVYAGTTEGLYRTTDAGTKWNLMTPKDIIINDVYVDPKNSQHVLMATDRSGVLESNDGASSFHPINDGFSERQVSAMVTDPQNPATVYVGVLNDKRFGGVFVSKDAGQTWNQISAGLDGNDIFALAMSSAGNLLAGTNHGIYRLRADTFEDVGKRLKEKTRKVTHYHKKHRVVTTETTYIPDGRIEGSVRGVAFAGGQWYAATSSGVYTSDDNGFVWKGGPVEKNDSFTGIAATDGAVLANGPHELYVSKDQAKTWQPLALPAGWTRVRYVAIDADGGFWLGGRMGVAYSMNQGQSWQICSVPINDISGLQYDPGMKRIIATTYDSDMVFGIEPNAKKWIWWNPGWRTHVVRSSNGHLVAATLLHGVIVQPEKQIASGGF
jgi:photosystem II stability/assembly factor-like uncharacterized protein